MANDAANNTTVEIIENYKTPELKGINMNGVKQCIWDLYHKYKILLKNINTLIGADDSTPNIIDNISEAIDVARQVNAAKSGTFTHVHHSSDGTSAGPKETFTATADDVKFNFQCKTLLGTSYIQHSEAIPVADASHAGIITAESGAFFDENTTGKVDTLNTLKDFLDGVEQSSKSGDNITWCTEDISGYQGPFTIDNLSGFFGGVEQITITDTDYDIQDFIPGKIIINDNEEEAIRCYFNLAHNVAALKDKDGGYTADNLLFIDVNTTQGVLKLSPAIQPLSGTTAVDGFAVLTDEESLPQGFAVTDKIDVFILDEVIPLQTTLNNKVDIDVSNTVEIGGETINTSTIIDRKNYNSTDPYQDNILLSHRFETTEDNEGYAYIQIGQPVEYDSSANGIESAIRMKADSIGVNAPSINIDNTISSINLNQDLYIIRSAQHLSKIQFDNYGITISGVAIPQVAQYLCGTVTSTDNAIQDAGGTLDIILPVSVYGDTTDWTTRPTFSRGNDNNQQWLIIVAGAPILYVMIDPLNKRIGCVDNGTLKGGSVTKFETKLSDAGSILRITYSALS